MNEHLVDFIFRGALPGMSRKAASEFFSFRKMLKNEPPLAIAAVDTTESEPASGARDCSC